MFNIEQQYFTYIPLLKQGYNLLMTKLHKGKDENDWWVVQTKPQAEFTAKRHLENQGLTTYCPLFKKEIIRGCQLKVKAYPLFSRYVFVKADHVAKINIHIIRSTIGVNHLLKVGEVPTNVTSQLIYELRQMESKKLNKTKSHFNPGDHVKVLDGIYHDIEAVYQMDDGLNRAVILLSILNKKTQLHIDKHSLNKI